MNDTLTEPEVQAPAQTTARPNCLRCSGEEFTYAVRTHADIEGFFIFCKQCGGVVAWAPHTSK